MEKFKVTKQTKIDDVKKIKVKKIISVNNFRDVKEGEEGGWINSYFMNHSDKTKNNSWIDKASVFTGQVLLNSFLESSRVHAYFLHNSEISSSDINGFHTISNCKIKNVKLSTDLYMPLFNAFIEKEEDLKIMNIGEENLYLNIYPHVETKEKMVFYGNIDFNIFYTLDNFKRFIKGEKVNLKKIENETNVAKIRKIDFNNVLDKIIIN